MRRSAYKLYAAIFATASPKTVSFEESETSRAKFRNNSHPSIVSESNMARDEMPAPLTGWISVHRYPCPR